ncbi:MAG: CoA transferase, partial [Alphaproteobacteria bacterium]|nr:CoA transferase [Alphaproteobacteria bacterium]
MAFTHILDGVTVLDLTQFIAGPVATRQLAAMGAEVIKVELAPAGDQARALPLIKNGRSAYYAQQNQGKKGLCLDLRDARGRDLVKRLVPHADVLIENFAPGVVGRLGLDWETVHEINPELIMCSISAFGQTGPLADMPGFDFTAQAYTGITSMVGEPGEAPPLMGVAIGDVGTSMTAVAAINGALFHRQRTGGPGQYLDMALIDFYMLGHSLNVELASASDGAIQPTRAGSHHGVVAPVGIFRAAEQFIVILGVSQDMWLRLVEAMGQPELAQDPRFLTSKERIENREALVAIIEAWLQAQASDAEALRIIQEARVPAAPVLSVAEAIREPHLLERGTVRWVEDPTVGRFQIPGMPLRFSDFATEDTGRAPYLGEHNGEVLGRLLGMAEAEVAA